MNYYNLKDITRMNEELGETGNIINKSGLDFALDRVNKEKSWLRQAALVVRAIIADHAFEDGNKRTAIVFFATIAETERYSYDKKMLMSTMHKISRKNIVDIGKIERMLKNVISR